MCSASAALPGNKVVHDGAPKELTGMERILKDRYKREFVEVVCPVCRESKIIALPEEPMPKCDKCKRDMVIKEVLTEGKY